MDLIIIVFVFCVGFLVGTARAYMKFAEELKDAADSLGIDLEKEITEPKPKQVTKLEVEKHGDVLYLYDRESHDFVCQGSSIEELASLAKKYKNIAHAVVLHNDKVFMFVDGTTTEYS